MRESDWVTRTEIESECLNGRWNGACGWGWRERGGAGKEVTATERGSESVEERRVAQVNDSEPPPRRLFGRFQTQVCFFIFP